MKYPQTPEALAECRSVTAKGEDIYHGKKVVGFSVVRHERNQSSGTLQIDVRDLNITSAKHGENLIIELDLADVMRAITSAALNFSL